MNSYYGGEGDQSEDPSGEGDLSEQHLVFSWVRGSLTLIGEKGVVPERVDVINEYNWVRWIRPRPVGAECKSGPVLPVTRVLLLFVLVLLQ
jgi:hypothetical protein